MNLAVLLSFGLVTGQLKEMGVSSVDLDAFLDRAKAHQRECGPISVWYCLKRFGKSIEYERVINSTKMGAKGISLEEVRKLCDEFGLVGSCVELRSRELSRLPLTTIMVIDSNHCVVYEGIDAGRVLLFEPSTGFWTRMAEQELHGRWTGHAIVFEPIAESNWRLVAHGGLACLAGNLLASYFLVFCKPRRPNQAV